MSTGYGEIGGGNFMCLPRKCWSDMQVRLDFNKTAKWANVTAGEKEDSYFWGLKTDETNVD